MKLSIIVAMTEDRVIGINNKLPWHISDDLKRFKAITMGHPIIMGRKTYESIGKPLPGRHNIVLSKKKSQKWEGVTVVQSLEAALKMFDHGSAGKEELFVIGGSSVFKEALPKADRLYLTLIKKKIDGDVYFPAFDFNSQFETFEESSHTTAGPDPIPYSFLILQRKNPQ